MSVCCGLLQFVAVCDSCFCPSNFVQPDLRYRLMFQWIANHAGTYVGCGLRAREACPPFSPREPQCRIRRHTLRLQLCLADGKSLLGVNSVRSLSPDSMLSLCLSPVGFALQTYVPADCESHRNVWRMRTAGEGGLSPVFASRAAVPHPAARFAQSTFHSRMTDAACNLAPVWTVRTICQHRPYCPTAHCLHCLSCWKVFFRRGWFLCPAIGIIAIFGW